MIAAGHPADNRNGVYDIADVRHPTLTSGSLLSMPLFLSFTPRTSRWGDMSPTQNPSWPGLFPNEIKITAVQDVLAVGGRQRWVIQVARTDVLSRRTDPHAALKIAALLPADLICREEYGYHGMLIIEPGNCVRK